MILKKSQKVLKQKEKTSKILSKFQQSDGDTGSPEAQVALITTRINDLTEHLKAHKKDFSTQRGLLKLVGQRKKLLSYLKDRNASRYVKLIEQLDLRK